MGDNHQDNNASPYESDSVNELARQLRRRASSRLQALQRKVNDVEERLHQDDDFRTALASVSVVVQILRQELHGPGSAKTLDDPQDYADRVGILRSLLETVDDKVRKVDKLLFQTNNYDIPGWLRYLLGEEVACLELGVKVLVVPTQASNFDTSQGTLETQLIADLGQDQQARFREKRRGQQAESGDCRDHVVLRVPRLEGRHAHWIPISLGHELGHHIPELDQRSDEMAKKIHDYLAEQGPVPEVPDYAKTDLIQDTWEVLSAWCDEYLCDLHALFRYGPAAISSLASYLLTIERIRTPKSSHPRGFRRLHAMLSVLEGASSHVYEEMYDTIRPWKSAADMVKPGRPWCIRIEQAFANNLELLDREYEWFADYYADKGQSGGFLGQRSEQDVVAAWNEIADRFAIGLPVVFPKERSVPFEVCDLVNGAWLQTQKLTRLEGPSIEKLLTLSIEGTVFVRQTVTNSQRSRHPRTEPEPEPRPGEVKLQPLRSDLAVIPEPFVVVDPDSGQAPVIKRTLSSIPLHLGPRFRIFRASSIDILRLNNPDSQFGIDGTSSEPFGLFGLHANEIEHRWGESIILHPKELVMAYAVEYCRFPTGMYGRISIRPELAQMGLASPSQYRIGGDFGKVLALQLINLGPVAISIKVGEYVCDLSAFNLPDLSGGVGQIGNGA